MKQSVLRSLVANFLLSQGENKTLCHQAHSQDHKVTFLVPSSVKDTLRTHCSTSIKKRCFGRVFFECWLPYLLVPWLDQKTVMSDKFPAKDGKQPVSFKKLKVQQSFCCNATNSPEVFWQFLRILELFSFHRLNFCHLAQIYRLNNATFPADSEQCKDTKTHCPFHEQRCLSRIFVSGDCHICYYPNQEKLYHLMTS